MRLRSPGRLRVGWGWNRGCRVMQLGFVYRWAACKLGPAMRQQL